MHELSREHELRMVSGGYGANAVASALATASLSDFFFRPFDGFGRPYTPTF